MRKFARCFMLSALVFSGLMVPQASAQVPPDIANPAPDFGDPNGRPDIPTMIPGLNLADVQFLFDDLLDPMRVSLLETVNQNSANDARLTEAARSIIRNHMVALQQAELAIRFLQANRDEILAGNNTQFNSVFGNIGIARDVAIVDPTPIAGTASFAQATGTVLAQRLTFNDNTLPNLLGQVKNGDYVFVSSQALSSSIGGGLLRIGTTTGTSAGATTGAVVRIAAVTSDDDFSNQELLLDSTTPVIPLRLGRTTSLLVYRVVRFERQTDPTRYVQVLQTFQSLRDLLSGLNPGLNIPGFTIQGQPISYNRRFRDMTQVGWSPGVAEFVPLSPFVQDFDRSRAPAGVNINRVADRLVRQAGYSKSDSFAHLDRIYDQTSLPPGPSTTDRLGRPTLPLLWTEDNDLPLDVFHRRDPTATDFQRPFFRDQQTIFGEPNNVFTQYIGRAFLEETLNHVGPFFSDAVSITDQLPEQNRRRRVPAGGPAVTIANPPLFEDAPEPERGTPTTEQTEFRKWQMIMESFGEYRTDLTQFDVAAVGLAAAFGGTTPGAFSAKDAGNYARFSGLLGSGDLAGVDFDRIEPVGKRGSAGFNPVVPLN